MDNNQLRELLDKYLINSLAISEKQLLKSLLNDPAYHEQIVQMMESDFKNRRFELEAEDIVKQRILVGIDKPDRPIHRVHFLKISWFRYAAAIVILFGIGAYLWSTKSHTDQLTTLSRKQAYKEIIAPGKDVAVLTLADGTTILLDSASKGVLANEGNAQIIKLANGQVAYDLRHGDKGITVMNTMTTPKGGKYQLLLSDGTKIWLNSASTIRYPTYFNGNERKVFITGEVYVEVAKNKSKPFIVDVNGKSSIEVLGTQFNVNSYNDEGDIKTTLIEGSVKVKNATNSYLLKPGQQLNGIRIIDRPNIEQAIAWKNGLMNFDNSDIQAVMRQIARWYNIEVYYEGEPPSDVLMGDLPMNASIEQVYNILRNIGIQFRVDGKKIIISK